MEKFIIPVLGCACVLGRCGNPGPSPEEMVCSGDVLRGALLGSLLPLRIYGPASNQYYFLHDVPGEKKTTAEISISPTPVSLSI